MLFKARSPSLSDQRRLRNQIHKRTTFMERWYFGHNDLYCPTYNAQPVCVISNFRQCGCNYHLNLRHENNEIVLSKETYPWYPHFQYTDPKFTKCSYIHCPLSEVLYFQWWKNRFFPYILYSHSLGAMSKANTKVYKPNKQLVVACNFLHRRKIEYKKVLNVESIAPDDIQAYELLIGINRENQTSKYLLQI